MLGLRRHDVDAAAVRRAVAAVQDPELHRTLGDLGMIREVTVGRNGSVAIQLALTTPGCPMTDTLTTSVTAAAAAVSGTVDVQVNFTVMTESERQALARRHLANGAATGASQASSVFAVASGKGGVGKSSIAANLAVTLSRQGKSVGLLDADVWGYSVPQLFGVRRNPIAMYETMLPVQAHGVRLMSVGFLVSDDQPIEWRGPMLQRALTQFVDDVHWGPLDVLLLDLPPGTGDVPLSMLDLLPDASLLAVTTPQQAARTVAGRIGVMAHEVGMPIAGVIENMSEVACLHCDGRSALFGEGGGEILADQLGVDLLGRVPLDAAMREAGDIGIPVAKGAPDAPSARALVGVAAALRPARRPLLGQQLEVHPVG